MSIDGLDPVKLTDGNTQWPQISPDGQFIACGIQIGGADKLAILPIEGGAPLKTVDLPRLSHFRWGIKWTSNGKALTYRDWANGVWKQNIEGGKPLPLDGLPEEKLAAFAWSSDGSQLAFSRIVGPRDVILIEDSSR